LKREEGDQVNLDLDYFTEEKVKENLKKQKLFLNYSGISSTKEKVNEYE
jgi:hypothetical protein